MPVYLFDSIIIIKHLACHVTCQFSYCFRNQYTESFDEYLKLSVDDALDAPPPLTFISMMAAKDPSFQDRFPGRSTHYCSLIWWRTILDFYSHAENGIHTYLWLVGW